MDHTTYLSPYSWRYGSPDMRALWSEVHKRRTWRKLWVVLAEVQAEFGLVTPAQVDDLRAHADQIDVDRAHEIEKDIQHDVMAEVKTFAEQCPIGRGIIHLGMTSMDIVDNTDALRSLGSQVLHKIGAGAVVQLGAILDGKVSLVAFCSPEAIKAGQAAGKLIGALASQHAGKGGGKPDYAQGGGGDPTKQPHLYAL